MALRLNKKIKDDMPNIDKDQKPGEIPDQSNEQFESDTHKLAKLHLSDPKHIITDEEMRNIKVGMIPPSEVPTEEAVRDGGNRIADHKSDREDDTTPGAQKITPWDVLGP